MNCKDATASYEVWLRKHTRVVEEDLEYKHQQMSADIFSFMRATYYRWVELWNESSGDLGAAPVVSAVGDLHVENFGTWRDQEGRVVWGINDFDETTALPYTNDLVRLAVSVHLSIAADELAINPDDACKQSSKAIRRDWPVADIFVLAERNEWLRDIVLSDLRDPVKFWNKIQDLLDVAPVPHKVRKMLVKALPERKLVYRVVHRVAGLGSLGRERFLAIGEWNGGLVAREVKARVPAATVWFGGKKAEAGDHHHDQYEQIIKRSVRCPDPSLELHKQWSCVDWLPTRVASN